MYRIAGSLEIGESVRYSTESKRGGAFLVGM
jgi:hypothetical protein